MHEDVDAQQVGAALSADRRRPANAMSRISSPVAGRRGPPCVCAGPCYTRINTIYGVDPSGERDYTIFVVT
jgi:hypothetical protein